MGCNNSWEKEWTILQRSPAVGQPLRNAWIHWYITCRLIDTVSAVFPLRGVLLRIPRFRWTQSCMHAHTTPLTHTHEGVHTWGHTHIHSHFLSDTHTQLFQRCQPGTGNIPSGFSIPGTILTSGKKPPLVKVLSVMPQDSVPKKLSQPDWHQDLLSPYTGRYYLLGRRGQAGN